MRLVRNLTHLISLVRTNEAGRLFWMYVLSGIGIIMPLMLIPFLARVLGPDSWGRVLLAQSFASMLIVVVEFGFNLSGTRRIAQAGNDLHRRREIVREISSAKFLCTLAATLFALLVYFVTELFHGHERLLAMALLWGITGGLNFGWYFLGTGRAVLGHGIDTMSRLLGVIATFALVRSASDDWLALSANVGVSVLALAVSGAIVVAEAGWPRLSLKHGFHSLQNGSSLAIYVVLAGLKNAGNRMLVGLFGGPSTVAIFGNAERITELMGRATEPAVRVIYPVMCMQSKLEKRQAVQTFWQSSLLFAVAVVAACILVALFARPIILLLCGPGYDDSVSVLRLLAFVPILKMAGTVLNTFWAQPHGLDRHMPVGIVLSGATTIMLAAVLVPAYGPIGMAGACIVSEIVFLFWSGGALFLSGNLPVSGESPITPVLPELAVQYPLDTSDP